MTGQRPICHLPGLLGGQEALTEFFWQRTLGA